MKKLALLMMVILSMVTFTGCFGPPPANAMTVSEEKIWPADIPSTVPKADESKIVKVTTLKNSVLVELGNVTEADYTAYVEQVTAAGWVQEFETGATSIIYKNGDARLDVTLCEVQVNETEKEQRVLIDYSKSITPIQK
ncbi:MAG: hypothetical protein ACRCTE_09290 [Cellulosilyticaceae bacterium]